MYCYHLNNPDSLIIGITETKKVIKTLFRLNRPVHSSLLKVDRQTDRQSMHRTHLFESDFDLDANLKLEISEMIASETREQTISSRACFRAVRSLHCSRVTLIWPPLKWPSVRACVL
jgi:hypothetical protein